ncbi:MAG: ribonuclease H family protein [Bacteroidetes bacterium]|nr:ribonuclease H family protein [Bacteroidota bacterium]
MSEKKKFYVVWEGKEPGIFNTWDKCKKSIDGFPGAKYKSFPTMEMAKEAFSGNPWKFLNKKNVVTEMSAQELKNFGDPIENSICVDAACSGAPGKMEYKGVFTANKQQIFHQGPFEEGTNNIGEFLAIVHALALCKKNNWNVPIYSDSKTAMKWVADKKAKTKLEPSANNEELFDLIDRAEFWLQNNQWNNRILKWETKAWGEIPADFGRK